jgi:hypothetical protein
VRAARFALLVLALALGATPAGAADLRRLESVGVAPVLPGKSASASPRSAAVRAAVARAVEAVALALEPNVPPFPDEPAKDPTALAPRLARALGDDPLDYANRYRILDDRGLRPALFERESGAEKEYVVVVEVQVDAERVGERLRAAGWLASSGASASGATQRLVLEGLADYRALDSIRRLLVERLGARKALPVELSRGRAVLAVVGGPAPAALAASLQAAAPPELRLTAVEPDDSDPEGVTLLVEWTPPVLPAASEPSPEPDAAD